MSVANPSAPQPQRTSRSARIAIGVALGVVVVLAPFAFVAFDGDSQSNSTGPVVKAGALGAVRAAVGQTAAAGSYEMDTETTTSEPFPTHCPRSQPTCPTPPPHTNQFTSHSIVNREPYAMVSYTKTSNFGDVTLHVNSTRVWQLGGATVGYTSGAPGVSLSDYSGQVIGTLGPGPGALAMISIASRSGYLTLEEETVATARPAGTGTVDGASVTYYDVTIDITKLSDAPNLTDIQRTTIAAALPILKQSGYSGTTERIGVDDGGFVREITASTTFDDGATTERHSVLSNFGCAPTVSMPNEAPSSVPVEPCATGTPATTTPDATASTTSTPSTTTSSTPVTTSPATPSPGTTPPNAKPPVQVLNGSGVEGAATARSNDLIALGWPVLPAGNAPVLRSGTGIQCAGGLGLVAQQLRENLSRFGVAATIEPLVSPLSPGYDPGAVCYILLGG